LFAILAAAILGNQTLIFLDPITILTRTVATSIWPALRYGVMGVESFLYRFPALWGPLDVIHNGMVQPLFQEVQPVFALAFVIALLFVGLVALNWWAERFWCRYLCPLGGILGLLSKLSLVRREVSDECALCARCTHQCPTGTIDPHDDYRSDPAECIVCFDCLTDCTREGIGFRWQGAAWRPARWRAYDPKRRQVLAVMGASLAGVALAGVEPIARRQPATMVRPPGADLKGFGALCVRCGACVRVCPTQGLQPSLFEGGIQNMLTPRLVPRLGYCSFGCSACGQVCPTGAIPPLSLEEKQQAIIGLARIDQDRCLPWAYDIPCIVCEEACPVSDKAIALEEVETTNDHGVDIVLQRPRVIKELCIGCGICEYQCPMGGESAIRVYAPTDLSGQALA
jgi:MauM/NapG family ferredoxin protein